jgi:hypothetical protein
MFLNSEYSLRLSDVSTKERKAACGRFYFAWESAFRTSRLFSRGSNVQTLLSPAVVTFFSKEGTLLGDKSRSERQIHQITRIPVLALRRASLQDFSIEERIVWTRSAKQHTKKTRCIHHWAPPTLVFRRCMVKRKKARFDGYGKGFIHRRTEDTISSLWNHYDLTKLTHA